MKKHDWMQILLWCSTYLFHDLFEDGSMADRALKAYFSAAKVHTNCILFEICILIVY